MAEEEAGQALGGSATANWGGEASSKVCVRDAVAEVEAYLSVNCAMESWSRDRSMLVTRESRVTFRGDNERSCESRWAGRGGRPAMSFSTGVRIGLSRKDACACACASIASRVDVGRLSARVSAPVLGRDLDTTGTAETVGDGALAGDESGKSGGGGCGGEGGVCGLVLTLLVLVSILVFGLALKTDGEDARDDEVSIVS